MWGGLADGWTTPVLARAKRLRGDLDLALAHGQRRDDARDIEIVLQEAATCISDAEQATRLARGIPGIVNLLNGTLIERAWQSIHRADELLILAANDESLRAQIPRLHLAAEATLAANDPRLATLRAYALGNSPWVYEFYRQELPFRTRSIRADLHEVLITMNARSDAAHAAVRTFRNAIIAAVIVLTAALLIAVTDPPGHPWLPICSSTTCAETWQVALAGTLGGLLSGLAALRAIQPATVTYALPFWLALLKIPAGGLTGLLGVIWMQNGVIGGLAAQPSTHVIAYAALFGAAQEGITRLADTKAAKLLGTASPGSPS